MTDEPGVGAGSLVVGAVVGLMLGLAVVVLLMIAVVAYAIASGTAAAVPEVFAAEAGEESGALAISFTPHARGMLKVVCAVALVYCLGPVLRRSRRHRDRSA
ncbi:MAG TPA: hypothetical protein VGC67_10385 [Cellulomonas sp.]